MPLIRCELFDYRVTPEVSAALIEKLTDALCEVVHPDLREPHLGDRRGPQPEELGRRRQAVAGRRDAAGPWPSRLTGRGASLRPWVPCSRPRTSGAPGRSSRS